MPLGPLVPRWVDLLSEMFFVMVWRAEAATSRCAASNAAGFTATMIASLSALVLVGLSTIAMRMPALLGLRALRTEIARGRSPARRVIRSWPTWQALVCIATARALQFRGSVP